MSLGFVSRYWGAALLLLSTWLGAAVTLVPWLIERAHAGRLPLADRLLAGRHAIPVDVYLADWNALVPDTTFVLLTALLLLFLAWSIVRQSRGRDGGEAARGRSSAGAGEAAGLGALTTLGLASWFGLIAGVGEAYYLAGRGFVLGEPVPDLLHLSQDSLWMAPCVDVVLFLAVGALLLGLGRFFRPLRRPDVLAGLFSFLTLVTWTMVTGRVALWAALLLAAGISMRIRNVVSRSPPAFVPLVRASAAPLVALVGVIAIVVITAPVLGERRQLASLPDARRGVPNVLLIVLDTQRAANTSLYPSRRRTTPNLERLAESSVVFDRAIAPSPWTLPSHATMFTGRPNHELGTASLVPLDDRFHTLAEVLRDRGYVTAAFVANLTYTSDFYGLDQGFLRYVDQPRSPGMMLESSWLGRVWARAVWKLRGDWQDVTRKFADEVNREFLGWLDRRGDRPFFVFLNYYDAHAPYRPPEPFDRTYSDGPLLYHQIRGFDAADYTPAEVTELETAYDSSIRYLDHQLGSLFEELEAREVLDETIVVVTSDHGESFGEHDMLGHGNTLYMPQVHVPLLIRPAGGAVSRRVSTPVGLQDLAATVLDLGGEDPDLLPGRSLRPLWEGGRRSGPADAAPVFSQHDDWLSVVSGDYHYLRLPDGEERLYRLSLDPREQEDIKQEPGAPPLAAFRTALARFLGSDGEGTPGRTARGEPAFPRRWR